MEIFKITILHSDFHTKFNLNVLNNISNDCAMCKNCKNNEFYNSNCTLLLNTAQFGHLSISEF